MVHDPRLRRILASRAGLNSGELDAMSDAAGWEWVYGHRRKAAPGLPSLCLTGFTDQERVELEAQASGHFHVVGAVSARIVALCAGANAGPKKLEMAKALAIPILRGREITALLSGGELPGNPQQGEKSC